MERANEAWIEDLRGASPAREPALADLRADLLRGLRAALAGRPGADDAFLEDAVQEALLRVLERLNTFEGRSKFVSWAMAIAVRQALTGLRRQHWRGVSLEQLTGTGGGRGVEAVDRALGPEQASLRSEMVEVMRRVMREQLTERQYVALTAELNGMPQEEIGRQLGSNRNAVYKLTHDARRKLKAGLEAAGFGADSLLEAWGT
jgi:RNA polymerase sigma-70 factor (ECF subfamily)